MTPSASIRFVYFDLGNVLVGFDPQRGCRNVAAWAHVSPEAVYRAVWDSGLEDQFEHGRLSPVEFARRAVRNLGVSEARLDPHGQPLLDLLSDMFTPLPEILPLVEGLRRCGIGVGILSNTCQAHWDWIQRQQWSVCWGWSRINVLSFEVGHMKPAVDIYTAAQRQAGVPAEHLFFTDDREENVAGAIAAGWQAERFCGAADLMRRLEQRLPALCQQRR